MRALPLVEPRGAGSEPPPSLGAPRGRIRAGALPRGLGGGLASGFSFPDSRLWLPGAPWAGSQSLQTLLRVEAAPGEWSLGHGRRPKADPCDEPSSPCDGAHRCGA